MTLNRRPPVPTQAPPQSRSGRPDLNRGHRPARMPVGRSCARSTRNPRLSHVLKRTPSRERPAGVEPALPPWQGDRLPLHHGRVGWKPNCQRPRAPGGTRTLVAALRKRCLRRWITGACSCADGRCCSRFEDAFKPLTGIGQSAEVGQEGLEPSPAWVRTRDAAASTSIPFVSF